jgi:hypothetical protein
MWMGILLDLGHCGGVRRQSPEAPARMQHPIFACDSGLLGQSISWQLIPLPGPSSGSSRETGLSSKVRKSLAAGTDLFLSTNRLRGDRPQLNRFAHSCYAQGRPRDRSCCCWSSPSLGIARQSRPRNSCLPVIPPVAPLPGSSRPRGGRAGNWPPVPQSRGWRLPQPTSSRPTS